MVAKRNRGTVSGRLVVESAHCVCPSAVCLICLWDFSRRCSWTLAAGSHTPTLTLTLLAHRYGHYERTVVDYVRGATAKNVWYYRDRLSTPRGPCTLPVLRECWVNGIIDENTLVWGQGLADWLPVKNVRTLVPQIRTMEVQVATWMKKTFSLKPSLAKVRKERAGARVGVSSQVDDMY